jgi:diguanylate cyclase (GGDEF)-like protein
MRILFLEDNKDVAAAVVAGLTRIPKDYQVCHCTTIKSALKELSKSRFDAALVDLGLPDSQGTDSAIALKTLSPQLAIVVLTAQDFEAVGNELMRHGIQDYLQKGDVSFARIDQSLRMALNRQHQEDELRRQAIYDSLTGLQNRGEFDRQLQRAIAQAERSGTRIAILAIDLDGFKQVNDVYGHHIGDIVLQQTAARLMKLIRAGDCAARVGGDEFAVILESLPEIDAAVTVAQKICNSLRVPVDIDGNDLVVSASIGIAFYPDHGRDPGVLYELADQALYSINRNGKCAINMLVLGAPRSADDALRHQWQTDCGKTVNNVNNVKR